VVDRGALLIRGANGYVRDVDVPAGERAQPEAIDEVGRVGDVEGIQVRSRARVVNGVVGRVRRAGGGRQSDVVRIVALLPVVVAVGDGSQVDDVGAVAASHGHEAGGVVDVEGVLAGVTDEPERPGVAVHREDVAAVAAFDGGVDGAGGAVDFDRVRAVQRQN